MNTGGSIESQHREVEKLFFRIANAVDSEKKTQLFEELADHLSAYAAIEDQMTALRVVVSTTAKTAP